VVDIGLRHRIELAIMGRTAPRAAEAVLAVLDADRAERAFTEERWAAERDDPEAGHTFRLQAVSRGSYAVCDETGEPGPHTDADWMPGEEPFVIEVRGWSLSQALGKAAQLPLPCWRLTR